jgi:hypothetical protein
MDKKELTKLVSSLCKPLGYKVKSGLFWKGCQELTILVQLQKSRWGAGVYVDFGATPSVMVTKAVPPGAGYWGLEMRPTAWMGPFFKEFVDCEDDHEDRMKPDQMSPALQWLIQWMEDNIADEGRVRQAVLDCRSLEFPRASIMMKDWARNQLKPPSVYFDGTPYYE